VVTNGGDRGVAISEVTMEGDDVDNWIIDEFEGRFFCGGADIILEICDKLNCLFVTDEEIEELIREADKEGKDEIEIELTNELFESTTNRFKKMVKNGEE